jgi:phosphate transport system substrate-binding protein
MFNTKRVYMPMPAGTSARVNRRDPSFASASADESGAVSISGAWALYPLAVRWQEEFRKAFPGVRVDVQAGGAGKGMADVLAGVVDIGMVSRAVSQVELDRGALPFAVAKDAVVATVSRRNPFLKELLERGLTRDDFRRVWVTAEVRSWEELLGREPKTPIHVFTRSDACGAAETWADFLGKKQEDLQGLGVFGDPGLVEAVRRDPLAIGYNNVNFAYDPRTKQPVAGVEICPVDLDGDGRLEPD